MSYFDPFPTIAAAPDEPPFHYCRFNAAYLGFILGALQDSIDRPEFWSGSTAEIGEMLQKVDQLYATLMQEVPPVTNLQTNIIHPWSWRRESGTWTRQHIVTGGYYPYVYNTSDAVGDRLTVPIFLPAGSYTVSAFGTQFPTGGRCHIVAGDSLSDQILATFLHYGNPQTYAVIFSAGFTLAEDYDGELSAIANHSGIMGTGSNEVALTTLAIRKQDA